MFTVCSKCNLRLTVTATDLRAAQGYVRCGRCHNVFNALAALADDPARQNEAAAADTQTRAALKAPEPPDEPEPPDTPADFADTDASLEFNPASTNINEVFIEAAPNEGTGTFESIILVAEDPADHPVSTEQVIAPQALSAPLPPASAVVTDVPRMRDALADPQPARTPEKIPEPIAAQPPEPEPEPEAEPEPEPIPEPEPEPAPEPVSASEQAAEPEAVVHPPEPVEFTFTDTSLERALPAAEEPVVNAALAAEIVTALAPQDVGTLHRVPETEPAASLEEPARPAARVPAWALPTAAAVLALCLLVQVVHHYRSELADTAALRGPLTALYQKLGQPLQPHWDMASYEIRQLGANSDGGAGDLMVRASISNRARRDQPLPLLRVVMQDRFGNRVAARDLAPAEYLERGAPQVSLLGPGQRIDVQVALQDPGRSATGFEIDACMLGHDRTVTCANDPGSH
jgi:predicted Zn finger-like uncharacterized protein